MKEGILYVVATPIGNLADITLRALEVLKKVDFVICEDTRRTSKLLQYYEIKKRLVSYHQHSKLRKIDWITRQLKNGKEVALVSDAGTPGINDPGGILVNGINKINQETRRKIKIVPIPGSSASTAALSVSGFPCDKFLFLGFLPRKKGRNKLLESLKKEKKVVVLYESCYRVVKTLEELKGGFGKRELCVCRELTKKFESIYRGSFNEVVKRIKEKQKGEFVVIINKL